MLKSRVVPSYVVAHQDFVARLLTWLPSLFEISSGFRALFSEVCFLHRQSSISNVNYSQIMYTEVSKKIVISKLDLSKKEAKSLCQAVVLNDFNCWKQVSSKECSPYA